MVFGLLGAGIIAMAGFAIDKGGQEGRPHRARRRRRGHRRATRFRAHHARRPRRERTRSASASKKRAQEAPEVEEVATGSARWSPSNWSTATPRSASNLFFQKLVPSLPRRDRRGRHRPHDRADGLQPRAADRPVPQPARRDAAAAARPGQRPGTSPTSTRGCRPCPCPPRSSPARARRSSTAGSAGRLGRFQQRLQPLRVVPLHDLVPDLHDRRQAPAARLERRACRRVHPPPIAPRTTPTARQETS